MRTIGGLKIDGRSGGMARWTNWQGKQRWLSARLIYVYWRGIVDHAAVGDPGPFEICKAGGTWHRVTITQADALEMLRTTRGQEGSYRTVLTCMKARQRVSGKKDKP